MDATHAASAGPSPQLVACSGCGAPFASAPGDQTRCASCLRQEEEGQRSPMQASSVAGYQLLHQLGAGRFSITWVAQGSSDGGVVLKLLRARADDPDVAQRFLDEAKRVSTKDALDHPGVARLLGGGVQLGGALFIVYEGGGDSTLADELRAQGRLPLPRALELCAQIAEALDAVHRADLLHLDLKPANVGLVADAEGQGRAILLDAATAHLVSTAGWKEMAPLPVSTAAYLSPEEARGAAPGRRADFYALGVLFYQLATGRLPLPGSSSEELVRAHREQRPLRLQDAGVKAHADVELTLRMLLAKDPQERFSSGAEVAVVLRALVPLSAEGEEAGGPDELDDPLPFPGPTAFGSDPTQEGAGTGLHPPEIERALARALLGEVAPETRTREGRRWPPRLPGWGTWAKGPRLYLAGAGALALIALVAVPASRRLRGPAEQATQDGPGQSSASGLDRAAQSSGAARALLRRLRRQLARRQFAGAVQSAEQLLARADASRADRARGARLGAAAHEARGDRTAALEWYRKALALTDDARERRRTRAQIQRLARAK
jgi:serine/threonine-protein kinase